MDIVCKMFLSTLTARCDMGVDSNGCWMGNWCQDIAEGDFLDLNPTSPLRSPYLNLYET